jgi:hypothetical protein
MFCPFHAGCSFSCRFFISFLSTLRAPGPAKNKIGSSKILRELWPWIWSLTPTTDTWILLAGRGQTISVQETWLRPDRSTFFCSFILKQQLFKTPTVGARTQQDTARRLLSPDTTNRLLPTHGRTDGQRSAERLCFSRTDYTVFVKNNVRGFCQQAGYISEKW